MVDKENLKKLVKRMKFTSDYSRLLVLYYLLLDAGIPTDNFQKLMQSFFLHKRDGALGLYLEIQPEWSFDLPIDLFQAFSFQTAFDIFINEYHPDYYCLSEEEQEDIDEEFSYWPDFYRDTIREKISDFFIYETAYRAESDEKKDLLDTLMIEDDFGSWLEDMTEGSIGELVYLPHCDVPELVMDFLYYKPFPFIWKGERYYACYINGTMDTILTYLVLLSIRKEEYEEYEKL